MADHDVVFDLDNAQMGWAPADCESLQQNLSVSGWQYDSQPTSRTALLPFEQDSLSPTVYDAVAIVILLALVVTCCVWYMLFRKKVESRARNMASNMASNIGLELPERQNRKRAPGENWRAPRHKQLSSEGSPVASPEQPPKGEMDWLDISKVPTVSNFPQGELPSLETLAVVLAAQEQDIYPGEDFDKPFDFEDQNEVALTQVETQIEDDDDQMLSTTRTLDFTSEVSQL